MEGLGNLVGDCGDSNGVRISVLFKLICSGREVKVSLAHSSIAFTLFLNCRHNVWSAILLCASAPIFATARGQWHSLDPTRAHVPTPPEPAGEISSESKNPPASCGKSRSVVQV